MSEPLRLALVVEGPTDSIVIGEVAARLLANREFVPMTLQPELSEAFQQLPDAQAGWTGVYRWCRQAAEQGGGRVGANPLFDFHDVLVVQVDADVAETTYERGHIVETATDLPCVRPCPPARATTDALRAVVLRWMGEQSVPPRTVLCTPSKSLEAWVLAALHPKHRWVADRTLECRANPEGQLRTLPKPERVYKRPEVYRQKASQFGAAWPRVRKVCAEAERFSLDFVAAAG